MPQARSRRAALKRQQDRRSLPRGRDQAIGNNLGVSDEYTRMLYCRGGLRLMPDHYWINGGWGVVNRTDC